MTVNNVQQEYSPVQCEVLYSVNQVNKCWALEYDVELKLLIQPFFLIIVTVKLPQEFVSGRSR